MKAFYNYRNKNNHGVVENFKFSIQFYQSDHQKFVQNMKQGTCEFFKLSVIRIWKHINLILTIVYSVSEIKAFNANQFNASHKSLLCKYKERNY